MARLAKRQTKFIFVTGGVLSGWAKAYGIYWHPS